MIEPPQIVQTVERRTAVIHIVTPREFIRDVMTPGYTELMAALQAQCVTPLGPWFTHHLTMTPDQFDFELGVPVGAEVVEAGRVHSSSLPAATAARTIYHGPYEGLPAAWRTLEEWSTAHQIARAPSLWETYLTGPANSHDPALWRTELTWPLIETP